MARVLRMPEVAANATEAVLAEWLVEEFAEFAALDTIATVETEKALVDVEADDAGVVLKTLVPPGALVEVGAPIAVLGAPGEAVADLDAVLAELGVAEPVDHIVPERRSVVELVETPAPEQGGDASPVVELVETPAPEQVGSPRVFASPLARKLARIAEIPVQEIPGTGPRGRILRRDVEAAVAERSSSVVEGTSSVVEGTSSVVEVRGALATSLETTPPATPTAETPHTRLRRAIASRLVESKQTAPHFYLRATVRAGRLVALRAELNEGAETRVSLNDLVVKAVAAAHSRVPEMNVVWTPDAVRSFSTVDVAVAVATDRGLVTPVLRDVTSLTVTAVAARVQDLATRAREGRLKQDELEGGTISVTNLGMYGVEEFAAIINPPHAAILAVGAVRDEPVVVDGAVVSGQVMTVTLSVDHRPVDGVIAARWLAAFVDLLEHPARILA